MLIHHEKFNYQSKLSLIIGENGSGKSKLLANIADSYISRNKPVIAIANCLYDKFRENGKQYSFIGGRYGQDFIEIALAETIKTAKIKNKSKFRIGGVLDYLGYLESIGISSKENRSTIDWIDFSSSYISTKVEKIEINLSKKSPHKELNLFLKKNSGETISVEDASSGEIQLLASLAFIGSKIENGSAIIIDEPENSLHPRWQRGYINRIFDLFSYFDISLIIATHSPMIISGIESAGVDAKIYKINNKKLESLSLEDRNLEYLMWDAFRIITPESPFLSRHIADLLNEHANGKLSYEALEKEFELLKMATTDEKQKTLIERSKSLTNRNL
ncbi:AAA family ATPase [Pseudomonas citronellolis]|uniref:AAA family ATPase n=1 Tax=Pseudomonas citronellolis TaxID=53408 RepID=UPI0022BA302C|nr:AAA family ATPase [Pseudomonas citronellolis]WBG62503.1 hypothetical protein ELR50_06235 [Pseudomonas citronellolis]